MDGNGQPHGSSSSGDPSPPANGTGTLAKLLNQLNVPTLVAVMFFGGTNLVKTGEDGRLTREDQQRVMRQVGELYSSLRDFEARQKDTVEKVTKSLDAHSQELKNQTQMLENQQNILNQLRRYQRPEE